MSIVIIIITINITTTCIIFAKLAWQFLENR